METFPSVGIIENNMGMIGKMPSDRGDQEPSKTFHRMKIRPLFRKFQASKW